MGNQGQSAQVEVWVEQAELCVRTLGERRMRSARLGVLLSAQDASALVAGLSQLAARALQGKQYARVVLQELALEQEIFEVVPYLVRARSYGIAREQGREEIATMFLTSTENPNPTAQEAMTGNEYAKQSVGARCTVARGRDRNQLDRLLHDRDHRVIAILLDNPILREQDVVKIAAMRPTRPEVLELLARHRRWASRYAVRKAIACNPHTPPPISRRLVPTMLKQDLTALVDAGSIPEEVRQQARAMIKRGGPRSV
jgi:hypothetical protein